MDSNINCVWVCVFVYRMVDPLCVYVYVYMCVSVPGAGTATGVCVSRQGVSGSARLRYKGPHNNPASVPLSNVPLSVSIVLYFCLLLYLSFCHYCALPFFYSYFLYLFHSFFLFLFSCSLWLIILSFIFLSVHLSLIHLFLVISTLLLVLFSLPLLSLRIFSSTVLHFSAPSFLCQAGVSLLAMLP